MDKLIVTGYRTHSVTADVNTIDYAKNYQGISMNRLVANIRESSQPEIRDGHLYDTVLMIVQPEINLDRIISEVQGVGVDLSGNTIKFTPEEAGLIFDTLPDGIYITDLDVPTLEDDLPSEDEEQLFAWHMDDFASLRDVVQRVIERLAERQLVDIMNTAGDAASEIIAHKAAQAASYIVMSVDGKFYTASDGLQDIPDSDELYGAPVARSIPTSGSITCRSMADGSTCDIDVKDLTAIEAPLVFIDPDDTDRDKQFNDYYSKYKPVAPQDVYTDFIAPLNLEFIRFISYEATAEQALNNDIPKLALDADTIKSEMLAAASKIQDPLAGSHSSPNDIMNTMFTRQFLAGFRSKVLDKRAEQHISDSQCYSTVLLKTLRNSLPEADKQFKELAKIDKNNISRVDMFVAHCPGRHDLRVESNPNDIDYELAYQSFDGQLYYKIMSAYYPNKCNNIRKCWSGMEPLADQTPYTTLYKEAIPPNMATSLQRRKGQISHWQPDLISDITPFHTLTNRYSFFGVPEIRKYCGFAQPFIGPSYDARTNHLFSLVIPDDIPSPTLAMQVRNHIAINSDSNNSFIYDYEQPPLYGGGDELNELSANAPIGPNADIDEVDNADIRAVAEPAPYHYFTHCDEGSFLKSGLLINNADRNQQMKDILKDSGVAGLVQYIEDTGFMEKDGLNPLDNASHGFSMYTWNDGDKGFRLIPADANAPIVDPINQIYNNALYYHHSDRSLPVYYTRINDINLEKKYNNTINLTEKILAPLRDVLLRRRKVSNEYKSIIFDTYYIKDKYMSKTNNRPLGIEPYILSYGDFRLGAFLRPFESIRRRNTLSRSMPELHARNSSAAASEKRSAGEYNR